MFSPRKSEDCFAVLQSLSLIEKNVVVVGCIEPLVGDDEPSGKGIHVVF